MEPGDLFPLLTETYEAWTTRLSLEDTPAHRDLYRVFFSS
jgi:hypothetical protein